MTLTARALTSTPTAHLACWRGGPTKWRVERISQLHYDAGDPWRGRKIGAVYGCLYHVTRSGLVPVRYDGHRMVENAAPSGTVYSWEDLRRRGYFG